MFPLIVSFALAAPLQVADIPNPRPRGSWVADAADVLPADVEARIDTRIDALQRELGAEIAVVTAPDVDGDPKSFAGAVLNTWQVGAAEANNGVVVLLVVERRRVEIEVGYGLESVLTDGATGALLDRAVIPRFKEGNLAAGIEAGVAALDAALRAKPDDTRAGTDGSMNLPPERASADGVGGSGSEGIEAAGVVAAVFGAGAAGGGVLAALGGVVFLRRRRRQCPVCRKEMEQLDEDQDDAHLEAGQRAEERVGSVDYEVRVCAEHAQVVVIPHRRWFSGYRSCSACGSRTAVRQSRTLVSATYSHGGRVEVTESCKHCSHQFVSQYSTPRRQRQTRSSFGRSGRSGGSGGSGRSGGGFGGGRSGGGGAGRSW